jgi:hypothetical protein
MFPKLRLSLEFKRNFSGPAEIHECSNHFNVMWSHISSEYIQDSSNQRLNEGNVKSDALHTFQEYLEKVESEETQPFKGIGTSSD